MGLMVGKAHGIFDNRSHTNKDLWSELHDVTIFEDDVEN